LSPKNSRFRKILSPKISGPEKLRSSKKEGGKILGRGIGALEGCSVFISL